MALEAKGSNPFIHPENDSFGNFFLQSYQKTGRIPDLFCGCGGMADAPALGAGGQPCRFKSCHPHSIFLYLRNLILGHSQAVRHRTLTPAFRWFESSWPSFERPRKYERKSVSARSFTNLRTPRVPGWSWKCRPRLHGCRRRSFVRRIEYRHC